MSEYVNFYKGEHASFSALTSYQPGAFYLTTDTERLYFANAADSILDLNQYIIFVTDIAALSAITKPQRGDIYYCEAENVLCTRGDNGWIQININTDTITTSLSAEKTVDDEDSNTIKWTLTLKETTSSEVSSTPREFTATWDISKDDIYDIIPEAQVEVVASVNANDEIEIHTAGDGSIQGADKKGVKIVPGNNINFVDNGNNSVTIHAAEYELSSPAGYTTVKLTDNGNDGTVNSQSVEFKAGHQLKNSGSTANEIIYEHGDITSETLEGTTTDSSSAWGTTLTYVEDVDTKNGEGEKGNGHVYSYTVGTITMPQEPKYNTKKFRTGSKANEAEAGSLYFELKDESSSGSGHTLEGEISKGLYYKILNDDGEDEVYYNTEYLPVYTIEQMNARLKGLNAVMYKGTVNVSGGLPYSDIHIGDAYMATENGVYGDESTKFIDEKGEMVYGVLEHVEAGDLFIATGAEIADDADNPHYGTIDPNTLVWTYIPAGNDYDSQYHLEHNNNTVTLKGNTSSNPDLTGFNGSITFDVNTADNEDIVVQVTDTVANGSGETGEKVVVKYGHKEYGENETQADNLGDIGYADTVTFRVPGEISNGHVASYNDLSFVMPQAQDVTIYRHASEPTILLKDREQAATGNVPFVSDTQNGTAIIAAEVDGTTGIKFKHRRNCATQSQTPTAVSMDWDETYTWVQELNPTEEGDGHIASYTIAPFTMPKDPSLSDVTFTTSFNAEKHGPTVTQTFSSPNGQNATITNTVNFATSTESLQLSAVRNDTHTMTVNIDMVWKSF